MKFSNLPAAFVSTAVAAAICFSPASLFPASANSGTLVPVAYVTTSGASGGQPVANLATLDQAGTEDNWNAYVEFTTPGSSKYAGYQTFVLPSSIAAQDITGLSLQANYRGPLYSYQVWTWRIYDWGAAAWVTVGTNLAAPDWVWSLLRFDVPAPYQRYVDSSGNMRIQLSSASAVDNADIDYEAISVVYAATSQPSSTPSATIPVPSATAGSTATATTQPIPATATPAAIWKPALNTSWQWQLTTPVDLSVNAQMWDIDLFDNPASVVNAIHAKGGRTVCYISAGTWENWRPDASQFPASVKGKSNGWPGEVWLDVRQIAVLGPIMQARLDLCRANGYDGVEFDNVDGYSNTTGFPLSYQDQIAYNIFLANAAHAHGLAAALKNDLDQVPDLLPFFDFAINEECFTYSECDALLPFILAGKPVFNVEYSLATSAFCPQANSMNFNSMKKKLALDAYRVPCR